MKKVKSRNFFMIQIIRGHKYFHSITLTDILLHGSLSRIVRISLSGAGKLTNSVSRQQVEGEHAEFLKTHVTSVLSHRHNLAWTFIDLLRWPADANPTINVLLTVLKDIADRVL